MAIRSAQLWSFTGNANAIQRSSPVPAGHVYIIKQVSAINNSGAGNIDVSAGVTLVAGWDIALIENTSTANGGVLTSALLFTVLKAGDKMFFKTNSTGTCRVVFSGADLS